MVGSGASTQRTLSPCEYKTGKTIATGNLTEIKEAVKLSTGQKYVVKKMPKNLFSTATVIGTSPLTKKEVIKEIEALKRATTTAGENGQLVADHRNVVAVTDYFETPSSFYVVMDRCDGPELFDRLMEKGSFYEEDAAEIVRLVVGSLSYMQSHNIIHGDIRGDHLLYRTKERDSDLVLCDFGFSKVLPAPLATPVSVPNQDGSLSIINYPNSYLAPERWMNQPYGKEADMWSIGVLTYFLLCGYSPFQENTYEGIVQMIVTATFSFNHEFWFDVSSEAKDFISRLIVVDPQQRMTAEQALGHAWFSTIDQMHGTETPVGRRSTVDLLPNVKKHFNAMRAGGVGGGSSPPAAPPAAASSSSSSSSTSQAQPQQCNNNNDDSMMMTD